MPKTPRHLLARGGSSRGVASASAYALWEYRSGSWVVKKPGNAEGYHSGSPPAQAGRFEGEIVRKYCEPILGWASEPSADR
jgi:hypothetical protein